MKQAIVIFVVIAFGVGFFEYKTQKNSIGDWKLGYCELNLNHWFDDMKLEGHNYGIHLHVGDFDNQLIKYGIEERNSTGCYRIDIGDENMKDTEGFYFNRFNEYGYATKIVSQCTDETDNYKLSRSDFFRFVNKISKHDRWTISIPFHMDRDENGKLRGYRERKLIADYEIHGTRNAFGSLRRCLGLEN